MVVFESDVQHCTIPEVGRYIGACKGKSRPLQKGTIETLGQCLGLRLVGPGE